MKRSTLLSRANAAFRNGDFESAVALYEEALKQAGDFFGEYIRFNRDLALRRLGEKHSVALVSTKESAIHEKPEIPVIKFDAIEDGYVPYDSQQPIDPVVKIIAFYLPQFHPIPENDEWWGKGFTEWSNVGKAVPNYNGHYQPHCPIHFGYYDLRVPEIMEEQALLAKQYGIYGFNYYYYWFAGKTLLETPLLSMLANKKIDMPFCLTWANENWTRRWDGQENDILIGQEHSPADSLAFIRNIVKYFNDPRYIRVNNKPLLIIYRVDIIPDIKATAALWREEVVKLGFDGLYLVSAQTFGVKSPEPFGFDASVEFPPHTVESADIRDRLVLHNKNFTGHIYSYEQCVENAVRYKEPDYKTFRAAMLSWDNTARKQNASHIFHGFSLLRYKQWLSSLCAHVVSNEKYDQDEKLVFVNAWNEWAEGTHLEPDRKYGYAYLRTTYDVVKEYDRSKFSHLLNQNIIQRSRFAVILHVHYVDLWGRIAKYLHNFEGLSFDLYVTTTKSDVVGLIKKEFPDSTVFLVENRGRDILPFIEVLRTISNFNYEAVCKIHTKRSVYRDDGDQLRDELFDSLIGSKEKIQSNMQKFLDDETVGMAVPKKFLVPHTSHNMTFDAEIVDQLANKIGAVFQYSNFPAGSMFWFRPRALSQLLLINRSDFDLEKGLADGTQAHAVERLFCVVAKSMGYQIVDSAGMQ